MFHFDDQFLCSPVLAPDHSKLALWTGYVLCASPIARGSGQSDSSESLLSYVQHMGQHQVGGTGQAWRAPPPQPAAMGAAQGLLAAVAAAGSSSLLNHPHSEASWSPAAFA